MVTVLTDVLINDLGLITNAELAFVPGLNVLTGETGAGKTLVVTALQLLSGQRAGKDQVKAGADRALVQAILTDPPAHAEEWLNTADEDLLISREIAAQGAGKNRVRIQGRLAPVAQLEALLTGVIELHGQFEHQAIAHPDVQRSLLDHFHRDTILPLRTQWEACYQDWREARRTLKAMKTNAVAYAREVAQLQRELEAIDAVDPKPGEEEALKTLVRRLQNSEAIVQACLEANGACSGEDGAIDRIGTAIHALTQAASSEPAVEGWITRLHAVSSQVSEVAAEIASHLGTIDRDPEAFDQAMVRMQALKGLFKVYGPTCEAVIAHADYARERIGEIGGGDDRIAELEGRVHELSQNLQRIGDALHGARVAAATALAAQVERELADLAMAAAKVTIEVEQGKPGPTGMDTITFLITTNPGQPPVTIGKAASGGERSRIALAVKVALADADAVPILVFDEVDAGIGGQTALAVGAKLQRLATRKQVLCVTHLAQIAAFADAHFLIEKTQDESATTTQVFQLDQAQRQGEIARMLSGHPDEPVALTHAAQLLADSARPS